MAKQGVLASHTDNFPQWYQDVVAKADLAENGPVRGTMVIKPYGYAIWELMQADLDARIKAAGAKNCYFPMFIPQEYLQREADHVEGFAPELAIVTHAGGKELDEPVVVRPTSETIINTYFSKWVQSYRDLPLLVNQWANVVRWELRPRLFLRTTEFLWQEGHTCHATHADARDYAAGILRDVYTDFMQNVLAIAVLPGRKTAAERFPGAINTLTVEAMMGDGKALQMGTSHELGQNFAQVFDTTYSSETGAQEYVWQTSWGSTTRMIGGLIMTHGDDRGLRLPPSIAPIQVVVLIVRDEPEVQDAARALAAELKAAGVRVELDARTDLSFGRRAIDWELKGVPVRVEVGPRDLANGEVTLVRRDVDPTDERPAKDNVPLSGLARQIPALLAAIQAEIKAAGVKARDARIVDVAKIEEAVEAAAVGFARIPWSVVGVEGEAALRKSAITVRCLQSPDGSLPQVDDAGDAVAIVARAY
jgi:prolyl-tRNA synthetase